MKNVWTIAAEQVAPSVGPTKWKRDPVGWVQTKTRSHLWTMQRQVMEAVRDHPRVAVKSAHSMGKSFLMGELTCWWLDPDTHAPGTAFVLTTAPTFPQVRTILWKEIVRAKDRGKLPGRTNQTEWWLGTEQVAMGRKPSDYNPDAFQGIHAEHVLVIIDEASGVPQDLWDAADSIASNVGSRIIAIGNPTNPMSHFKRVCDSPTWHTIRIDGLSSPNFTGEPVPDKLRGLLLSPEWVDRKKQEWGEESPMFVSRVRGEFPTDTDDGVIPFSWADACRSLGEEDSTPVELGVDVGGGGDETVIAVRRGRKAYIHKRLNTEDPTVVEGAVLAAIRDTGATACKIDAIGIGWAVAGNVRERAKSCDVRGVKVSKASRNSGKFKNLRSELWWEVGRELSRTRGWDLGELTDDDIYELTQPKYHEDASGRIVIESKDDLRRRIKKSPDVADALLLAFYSGGRKQRPVRATSTRR